MRTFWKFWGRFTAWCDSLGEPRCATCDFMLTLRSKNESHGFANVCDSERKRCFHRGVLVSHKSNVIPETIYDAGKAPPWCPLQKKKA